MTWGDDIRERFPDWLTASAIERWRIDRPQLVTGQTIRGVVIARAPFGVWLDISVGHPALLFVPEMAEARERRITFEEYPPIGAILEAQVAGIAEDARIGLTQRHLQPPPEIPPTA